MLELGHRERHLLSGLGVQVLLVAFLVFVYTQAVRQMKGQREQYLRLKEQVSTAMVQVTKAGSPKPERVQAKLQRLKSRFPTRRELEGLVAQFGRLAKDRFGFQNLQARVGGIEKTVQVPLKTRPALEIPFYLLELEAEAQTKQVAAFLETVDASEIGLLCPLDFMELQSNPAQDGLPVVARIRWLAATAPVSWGSAKESVPSTSESDISLSDFETPVLDWGPREELFRSSN